MTPRLRGAAWALLAAVLSAVGAVASRGDGVVLGAVHIGAVVLAVLFGIAAIVYGVLALIHVATTPRVSFSESYDDAPTGDDKGPEAASSVSAPEAVSETAASKNPEASKNDG